MDEWVIERLSRIVGRGDRRRLPALARETVERHTYEDLEYSRVNRNLGSLGRGMVIVEDGVIADYPRVRRIFHLKNAIRKYYYSPYYVEELVAGYHARIARVGGRLVAFLRDGRCCPFTTDRATDLVPEKLFEDHPRLVACLVINGSEIPYVVEPGGRTDEPVGAQVVDLIELDVKEPLAPAEKYRIFDSYSLAGVAHAGPFEPKELEALDGWVEPALDGGAIGIVLKPSERHHRPLQYAAAAELLVSHPVWLAMSEEEEGIDTYFQRLLRSACAMLERDMSGDDVDLERVAGSLFEPLLQAVAQVERGEPLRQRYTVWMHRKEAAEALLPHLREIDPTADHEALGLEAEGGGWRLRFERVFREATAALARRISGASYLR